jgi:hypothetical protein
MLRSTLISLLAFVALAFAAGAQAAPRDGAVAAMLALPPKYSNGVLKVFGNGGNPQPALWFIIARDKDNLGTIRKLTIANGRLIKDTPSGNFGQMFRNDGYLYPQSINLDSGDAFALAAKYAAANQKSLGAVDYSLVDQGANVDPMWFLVCRDARGKVIGRLQIVATTGAVVSQKGFDRAP